MTRRRRKAYHPDDPRRDVPPAPIAELLGQFRSARGWEQRLEGAQVHERWPEIAGATVAAHTEPVRLYGGVLVIRADSSAWATQVRYLTGELVDRANAVLGEGQVERVVVQAGPTPRQE